MRLPYCNGFALVLRQNFCTLSHALNVGRTDKHRRKLPNSLKIEFPRKRAELATVCVAPDRSVQRAEIHVGIVRKFIREQNEPRAGTEHGKSLFDRLFNGSEQSFFMQ